MKKTQKYSFIFETIIYVFIGILWFAIVIMLFTGCSTQPEIIYKEKIVNVPVGCPGAIIPPKPNLSFTQVDDDIKQILIYDETLLEQLKACKNL
jgi:hypothetical protein